MLHVFFHAATCGSFRVSTKKKNTNTKRKNMNNVLMKNGRGRVSSAIAKCEKPGMSMKRVIMGLALSVVALCGWAADGSKTLKVKLDIVDFGDSVVLYRIGHGQQTFLGKDGKFEFEVEVDTVCQGILLQPKLLRGDMDDPRYYSIPIVGGESVRVWDIDKSRYDVDGTGFYADYHQVDLFDEEAGKEQKDIAAKYRAMMDDSSITKEQRSKFYDEVYRPSYARYQQALTGYVKDHPKQEAAVWLIHKISGLDKMKETFMLFDSSVREGRMKTFYEEWVRDEENRIAEETKEKESQKKQAEGIEAPAFTLKDLSGNPLALASLRGKYVILDFWGSWCVWCIKGFPLMKEYYAKYPGKFEILGVDCNDSEEKWRDAVKKHELPWLHVYCPKESTLLADYGITGFPTKIIIGPDGKIVKTILGEDPAFYTLLDELFGQ